MLKLLWRTKPIADLEWATDRDSMMRNLHPHLKNKLTNLIKMMKSRKKSIIKIN